MRLHHKQTDRDTDQCLKELIAFKYDLPIEAIQLEMLDFFYIVANGARKYALNNWLEHNGTKSSEKDMHASMGRHWGQSSTEGSTARDKDSGYDPLLHLMCRAGMVYTRRIKGIVHPDDYIPIALAVNDLEYMVPAFQKDVTIDDFKENKNES